MPQPIARPRPRAEHRRDHRGIAGAVVGDADQRLDDGAALHLVIVLADDPFLAAHVRARRGSSAGRPLKSRRRRASTACGVGVADARLATVACRTTAGRPSCRKCHVQVGDLVAADRTAAAGRSPRNVPSTVASTSSLAHSARSASQLLRRHGQDHALLRLRRSRFRCTTGPRTSAEPGRDAPTAPSFSPISPTAELKPPAPQSVMA